MNLGFSSFLAFVLATWLAIPLAAFADRNPDFDSDAKPILRMQPNLLDYVEHNFEVRDVGLARVPGDEDRRPMPPFIFQARPHGASGAYFITLLIEPGPQGRILKVIDPTHPHRFPAGVANGAPYNPPSPGSYDSPGSTNPSAPDDNNEPPSSPPPAAPAPANPPPSSVPTSETPSGPTSATPSGPIPDSANDAPSSGGASLAPPPDPAPSH